MKENNPLKELENHEEIACLNCGETVGQNYCPHCGQSRLVSRITMKETIGHFLSFMLSFKGPLFSTLKHLFSKPGKMFREYLAGARKKYYNPVSLFVLFAFIHILLRRILDYKPISDINIKASPGSDGEDLHFERLTEFMADHVSDVYLALALAFAISAKIFFRKRYNFAEYLTIGLYGTSVHMIVQTAIVLIIVGLKLPDVKIGFFTVILIPLFYIWSLLQPKTIGEKLRAFAVAFSSLFFYVVIILIITLLLIFL